MKSEPDAFSIDHLKKVKTAGWDGVRNYQARNFMRTMRRGDLALFYHSNTKPSAIVGLVRIVREAYPDPTQFDPVNEHYDPSSLPDNPRWSQVDVAFVERFPKILCLEDVRSIPALHHMMLLKRGRLSVQPVTSLEWSTILKYVRSRHADA